MKKLLGFMAALFFVVACSAPQSAPSTCEEDSVAIDSIEVVDTIAVAE